MCVCTDTLVVHYDVHAYHETTHITVSARTLVIQAIRRSHYHETTHVILSALTLFVVHCDVHTYESSLT